MQFRQSSFLQFAEMHVGVAAVDESHDKAAAIGVLFDRLAVDAVKNRDTRLELPARRRPEVGDSFLSPEGKLLFTQRLVKLGVDVPRPAYFHR